MAPSLVPSSAGLLLTWLEPTVAPEGHALYFSKLLENDLWSQPTLIASGPSFFANWADRPGLVESPDGSLYAHWLEKIDSQTYAYGARLTRSTDGGASWTHLDWIHDDSSATEHGFVSYASNPSNTLDAFWLDGRTTPDGGAMQLRTARITTDGAGPSKILDDRVCDCCATNAATTPEGALVVYRDRSLDEVRDITVVRSAEKGWGPPALVYPNGWRIEGCPVNGPAIATSGQRVAIAWFSLEDSQPQVYVAFSDNAGRTFGSPFTLGENPLGRVDLTLDQEGNATVSWLESGPEQAEIRWQSLSSLGPNGAPQRLTTTSSERSSGVPRVAQDTRGLVFVWVDPERPKGLRGQRIHPGS